MSFIGETIDKVKDYFTGEDNKTPETMKDEDYINLVEDVYKLNAQKMTYERQWYLNLSFLLGQQWVEWDNTFNKLVEPKVPKWRVRHVANDIIPSYRKDLAKLNKNRPTLFISSASVDVKDEEKAKESNQLVDYWWSTPVIGMENELNEWKQYALSCGTGFMKVCYEPTIGTKRAIEKEDGTTESWQDGEIQLEACSPFEIIFDPMDAKKWKDIRRILHHKSRTLEYIKERYPQAGDKVTAEKEITTASNFWQKIQSMMGTTLENNAGTLDKAEKSAIVKELWIMPCAKFPKGQKIVAANKVLLDKQDLPYKWMDTEEPFIPIVPLYDIKVPGRIFGRSKIEDLIPIQKAKNELISHVRENERLTSKPKVLNPRGSGITDIDSEPGEVVEWDPTTTSGHKPEWMVPPPIPNYVINGLGEMYQRDFANVASIHEISKGQVPPGVSSGIAINYLQEQDDTIIGDVVRQYERALEIVGNMMLSLAKQFYIENRELQVVNSKGNINEFGYKKETKDKQGNVIEEGTIPRNSRLIVEAGSSLPKTQSAKQAFIIDLFKMGIFGPQGDKTTNKRVLKMLEMGNINEMYEDEAADRIQAEEENESMKKGISQMVYPYQDQEVHLQTHDAFMKTKDFMPLDEGIKQMFMAHRDDHLQLLAPPMPIEGQKEEVPA